MSNSIGRTRKSRRSGVAAIELAFVLPTMLSLAATGADLSRAVASAIVVANAARSGAEYGSMNRFVERDRIEWENRVRETVLAEGAQDSAVSTDEMQVSVVTRTDAQGLTVCEVRASYDLRTVMRLPFLPAVVPIRRTATMRQIR